MVHSPSGHNKFQMEKSKGIIISVVLCFCLFLPGFGMKYQIKLLNTPSIIINGEKSKVGDWFDDNAIISWENDKQAMKVLSEDNHIYTLSAGTYKNTRAHTFLDYIISVKPMIARGNSTVSKRLDELQYGGCVLMDSLYLDFSNTGVIDEDVLTGEVVDSEGNPITFEFIKEGEYFVLNRETLMPVINKWESDEMKITIFFNGEQVMEGFEIEISE